MPGARPPVMLLPGLVGADWFWRPTAQRLHAAGFGTIVWETPIAQLDRRLATSIEALRRETIALLDDLGLDRAILCGNSLGALLALDVAGNRPERVAAAIVCGSPGMHEGVVDLDYLLDNTDRETLERYGARIFFTQPDTLDQALVDETIEMVLHRPTAVKILRAFQAARSYDTLELLPRVACRVCLIWGEQDLVTPLDNWRPHLARLPDAELHVIAGCGHAPMVERPAEWLALTEEFVERATAAPAAA
ncbi:MAG TPA: alpha/beta hydrolase [Conexibacter sp.]|nr:alpha/beta hydrolase [Conexibacter sp.]